MEVSKVTPDTAARKQEQRIAEARTVLQPSRVRLHHVPDWFRRRLLKAFEGRQRWGHRATDGWSVLQNAINQLPSDRWADHCGSTTIHKRPAFVAEPYGVSESDLASIAELARRSGCEWFISSNSWWYPGATIRIAFVEPEQVNQ